MKENNKWKFSDVENTAVFITRQIVNEGLAILYVSHDEDDGAWQFHHGYNVSIEDAMIISLAEIVSLDNTFNQLSDLPLGWIAVRQSVNSSWEEKRK